jgi:hypothetical protein
MPWFKNPVCLGRRMYAKLTHFHVQQAQQAVVRESCVFLGRRIYIYIYIYIYILYAACRGSRILCVWVDVYIMQN